MGFISYIMIEVLKDNKLIYQDDFPPQLLLEKIPGDTDGETFEEGYLGRQDYHTNKLEEELISLSKKYSEVTFLLRECSTDLDFLRFDYFWNGKTCHREMKIETPLVTEEDFN